MSKREPAVKVCCLCGKEIQGSYDFVKAYRKGVRYFHKNAGCLKGKEQYSRVNELMKENEL